MTTSCTHHAIDTYSNNHASLSFTLVVVFPAAVYAIVTTQQRSIDVKDASCTPLEDEFRYSNSDCCPEMYRVLLGIGDTVIMA
jgi:hypothetical protein